MKAGAASAGLAALAWWRFRSRAPSILKEEVLTDISFDYTAGSEGRKLAVVHGKQRDALLNAALDALGGMKRFIANGDRVLVKVNAAFASPPMLCATTHPDLVKATVRQCYAAGASKVIVTDNPINDPPTCFQLSGIQAAAEEAGAVVTLPSPSAFTSYSLDGAKHIRNWPVMTAPFKGVTKLIGLAPVKDHYRSGASMTMKNWYGLLGGRRNLFHQDVHTLIQELAVMVRPTLVVLDGTMSMMQNGPTGGSLDDLKSTQTLIAGADPVAVDTLGAGLLQKALNDVTFIQLAERAGIGTTDVQSLNPIEVTL